MSDIIAFIVSYQYFRISIVQPTKVWTLRVALRRSTLVFSMLLE